MRLDAVKKNAISRLLDLSDSASLDIEILLSETIDVPKS